MQVGGSVRGSRFREWARKQGMAVSRRGRIPREVTDAYHRAH
ncbi:Lsr2 dimerization domain-containing protein [Actinomycetospora lutea]